MTGATTSRFAYDGLNALAEYNSTNALQRRWVYDPDGQPVLWYEGTGLTNRRFLSADERGSIISTSDSTGAKLAINTYDEYGNPAAANSGRYGYTGQAWLPSVTLWYYKARVYEPQLGRFLQPDPIGYVDSPNLYAYALNDPVNLVDPLGLAGVIIVTGERTKTCALGVICYSGNPFAGDVTIDFQLPKIFKTPVKGGRETPHKYHITRVLRCSADQGFEWLKANSAPGAPPAQEGFTPRINLPGNLFGTGPPNPISQLVNSSTRTIVNTTLRGHDFYYGQVTLHVSSLSDRSMSRLDIVGTGTTPKWIQNDVAGIAIFSSLADNVASLCAPAAGPFTP